jgi:hypothetical protein
MPGVHIVIGAVIGANAVVTSDVPPYAITAEVPAKTIKYRFPESVIDALLQSEWWELSPARLQTLPTGNIFQFVDELKNRDCRSLAEKNDGFETYVLEKS